MIERQVFLDESKENIPSDGFTVVETEIEFLQADGAERLWVRGEQLCEYARAVYQARNLKVSEAVSPRVRLRGLLGASADHVSSSLLIRLLEILDREQPQSAAELLFHLTHDEFWIQPVSPEHAARFLTIDFDVEIVELAEAQRQIWLSANQERKLADIYASEFERREKILLNWLFDKPMRKRLGEFPLHLSDRHAEVLDDEIGRRLRASNGAAISEFPQKTPNKKIYAKAAIEHFSHNRTQLTSDAIVQISSLLSSVERARLERLLDQNTVAPLDVKADFQTALQWATEKYLPFLAVQEESGNCAEGDVFAQSFAEWTLENYPRLTNLDRETSPINLRTFYTVRRLIEQNYWVLWTVVDGLSFTNHQKLLQLIGEKSAHLRVAENSPQFAVLPTITEKAKFGLTTGKFPQENVRREWSQRKNFQANFPDGVYTGDTGTAKLAEGLKRETPTVCYWNYMAVDECYHEQTDSMFLKYAVDTELRGLADKINHLVSIAKDINRVAVVVCSDHGQMITNCRKLDVDLTDKHAHGRTVLHMGGQTFSFANSAYAKTNNGETVDLNPTSFRLSEPVTVALGSTYFVDMRASEKVGAIGVHGGLYPEEVVVGLAVLMRQPSYKSLTATAHGTGETGKAGTLSLKIDNPNLVMINPLMIEVENLEVGNQGELLLGKVAAHQTMNFEIPISKFPAANDGEEFGINGILRYEFEDGMQEECPITGKLVCKSLYTAKNPSLLNRFKK